MENFSSYNANRSSVLTGIYNTRRSF